MEVKSKGDLVALRMAVFDQAKSLLYWSIGLSVGATLVSLLSSLYQLDQNQAYGPAIALVVAASAVGAYVLYRLYEGRYDLTSELQRMILLERGLGWVIPPAVRTELRKRAGKPAQDTAERYREAAEAYFASEESPSARRLLDLVQESAFHTSDQYRELRSWLWLAVAALAVVALITMYALAVSDTPQDSRVRGVQFVMALIPAVLSLGVVNWIFKLGDLHRAIDAIDRELENLRLGSHVEEREILRLTGEYNCQTAQGLPVPGFIRDRRRGLLNSLWAERREKVRS